jgi:hypothetical protein
MGGFYLREQSERPSRETMRAIKTRPRFHCDFCSHTSTEAAMTAHERICWLNPNRYCSSCKNTGWWDEGEPCWYCNKLTRDSDAATIQAKLASRLPKEEVPV